MKHPEHSELYFYWVDFLDLSPVCPHSVDFLYTNQQSKSVLIYGTLRHLVHILYTSEDYNVYLHLFKICL